MSDAFVPAGLTQVVYDTRDEGLHFPEGGDQPVRRVRSHKRETLKWNNPANRHVVARFLSERGSHLHPC